MNKHVLVLIAFLCLWAAVWGYGQIRPCPPNQICIANSPNIEVRNMPNEAQVILRDPNDVGSPPPRTWYVTLPGTTVVWKVWAISREWALREARPTVWTAEEWEGFAKTWGEPAYRVIDLTPNGRERERTR